MMHKVLLLEILMRAVMNRTRKPNFVLVGILFDTWHMDFYGRETAENLDGYIFNFIQRLSVKKTKLPLT